MECEGTVEQGWNRVQTYASNWTWIEKKLGSEWEGMEENGSGIRNRIEKFPVSSLNFFTFYSRFLLNPRPFAFISLFLVPS